MSLGEILDDIKEGSENIDTTDVADKDCPKEVQEIVIEDIKEGSSLKCISQETLEKVNRMFNLLLIRDNVDKLDRVDYSIAEEVFTMIPDISKAEKAKLTSAPSANNKKVIGSILDSTIDDKLDSSLVEDIGKVKTAIDEDMEKFEKIYEYLVMFKEAVADKVTRFRRTPPLVIVRNREEDVEGEEDAKDKYLRYNLYTDHVKDIIELDDAEFEYEKYSGVLVGKFKELFYDQTLGVLANVDSHFKPEFLSLDSFVRGVESLEGFLRGLESELRSYSPKVGKLLESPYEAVLKPCTVDVVNEYNSVVDNLGHLVALYNVTREEDNCFSKVISIIEFLD